MFNFFLYIVISLIWGSTWLAIKLQLTQVPLILSVGYRFCLAALILYVFCLLTKRKLRFSRRDHGFLLLQGITLFGLSYCMSYLATSYLTSGLVAVIYSTVLMWNILNLRIFMGQFVAWRAFWGGLLGLGGICIIFWNDLSVFAATRGLIGLAMGISGAYLASVGNIIASRNAKIGLPVTQTNIYGMAYGGLLTLAIHFGGGNAFVMDWSIGYLVPLLYLSVFGSVVAFGCYMLLIGRIGADYAAYTMLTMPVLALIISTFFEDYQWTANAVIGVSIVLSGNLIILTPAALFTRIFRRINAVLQV